MPLRIQQLIKATVVVAMLAGIVLSPQLWLSTRAYPLAPLIPQLPAMPAALGVALFAASLALLLAIALTKRPRQLIIVFLILLGVLGLFDQNRWQPWVVQYFFMLIVLAAMPWENSPEEKSAAGLDSLRLIISCIYIFSGLQKLNANFFTTAFPTLVDQYPSLTLLGYVAPWVEIGAGLGLLTTKFRLISLSAIIIMHAFILALIGPFGKNWNSVVWPWNIAMPVLTILLFHSANAAWKLRWRPQAYQPVVLAFFAILPGLSFFNRWDSYPSFSLYSGNVTEAIIVLKRENAADVPPEIAARFVRDSQGNMILNPLTWSMDIMNVPRYPEPRVHKALARALCEYISEPEALTLIINYKSSWFKGAEQRQFSCDQL